MTPALGSAEKNKITEYKDVRAYILFRKPADIRIIGLYPVVRNKAFDMVSDRRRFQALHPVQEPLHRRAATRSIEPSTNKLENLRPQHFLDALLVRPVDPETDKVLLENFTDEDNAFYILHEVTQTVDRRTAPPSAPSGSAASTCTWRARLIFDDARQHPHRRALLRVAGLRQRAVPQAHRNQPPARRIRRGDRHRQNGHQ